MEFFGNKKQLKVLLTLKEFRATKETLEGGPKDKDTVRLESVGFVSPDNSSPMYLKALEIESAICRAMATGGAIFISTDKKEQSDDLSARREILQIAKFFFERAGRKLNKKQIKIL